MSPVEVVTNIYSDKGFGLDWSSLARFSRTPILRKEWFFFGVI